MSSHLSFVTLVTSSSSASSFWWNPPQVGTVSLSNSVWVAQLGPTLCHPKDSWSLYPWDSPGKNTGVGGHSPLQGIFPTQGLNPLHCRQILYHLSHQGNPSQQLYNKKKGNQGQSLVPRGHWPDLTLSNLLHFCNTNCSTCFQKIASRTSFCALSF